MEEDLKGIKKIKSTPTVKIIRENTTLNRMVLLLYICVKKFSPITGTYNPRIKDRRKKI